MDITTTFFIVFASQIILSLSLQRSVNLRCNYATLFDVDMPHYLTYPINVCYGDSTSSHQHICNYTSNILMKRRWTSNNQCLQEPDQITKTTGLASTDIHCDSLYSSKTCHYITVQRYNALAHTICSPDSALDPQTFTFIPNHCLLYNDNTAVFNVFDYNQLPYTLTQIQYNDLDQCLDGENGVNMTIISDKRCDKDSYYNIIVPFMTDTTAEPTIHPSLMTTTLSKTTSNSPTQSPVTSHKITPNPTAVLSGDMTGNKSDNSALVGGLIGASVAVLFCGCFIAISGVYVWKRKKRLIESMTEVDDDSIDVTDTDYQFEGMSHSGTAANITGLYSQEQAALLLNSHCD